MTAEAPRVMTASRHQVDAHRLDGEGAADQEGDQRIPEMRDGGHMWKGTSDSLKPIPTRMRAMPARSDGAGRAEDGDAEEQGRGRDAGEDQIFDADFQGTIMAAQVADERD